MPTSQTSNDDIIDVTEVAKAARGRKPSTPDPEMVKLFTKVKPGSAAVLRSLGPVEKEQRPKAATAIRRAWSAAHGEDAKCRIDWNPATKEAQVRHAG